MKKMYTTALEDSKCIYMNFETIRTLNLLENSSDLTLTMFDYDITDTQTLE